jgi:hypothetical protein
VGFEPPVGQPRAYHIVRQRACKSDKIRYAEFILCLTICMPPSQAALRTALVTAMAFAHHKAQEKTAPETLAPSAKAGPVPINIGERCGGE